MSAALPPKVFVSYSHDSDAHRERVLALADRLRSQGLDARVDQYVDNPSEGWPQWMARQIVDCDFSVLVCTPTYRQRFEREDQSDAGKGAKLEGMILSQLLYEAQTKNEKIIAVLFEEGKEADIPLMLRPYTYYRLMAQYEKLYRRLTGQHDTPAPAIGAMVVLPPRPRPELVVVRRTVVWQLTLKLDDIPDAALNGVLDALRQVSGDPDIRLLRTLKGSIILELEMTEQAAERLASLAISGELSNLLGHPVIAFTVRSTAAVTMVAPMANITDQRLIEELAKAFYDPERARNLAIAAGFPVARIPVFRVPDLFWHAVVEAASSGAIEGRVQALANAAARANPANDVFKRYRAT